MLLKEKEVVLKTGESVSFRKPNADDGSDLYRIVKQSQVLDVNSSYSYLMWAKYFNDTSLIAEIDNQAIGFVSGFIQPNTPDTLFVWQIAVDKKYRGNGLATILIEHLIERVKKEENIRYLEATVTPSNIPSSNLFKGMARKYRTNCSIYTCFSKDQFPDANTEEELTYRIGPLK